VINVPSVKWSESHGADGEYKGAGAMYFTLPYMLKSKHCVCLGSGSLYVPMMMLEAQKHLLRFGFINSLKVTLVDADTGIWGRPTYMDSTMPEGIELVRKLTKDAAAELSDINYLHVDADHSFEGAYEDLQNYYPLMTGDWAITIHDTHNESNAHLPIGTWRAAEKFSSENNLELINFKIGCGTALIRKRNA